MSVLWSVAGQGSVDTAETVSEVLFSPYPSMALWKGPASLDLKVCDPENRSVRGMQPRGPCPSPVAI